MHAFLALNRNAPVWCEDDVLFEKEMMRVPKDRASLHGEVPIHLATLTPAHQRLSAFLSTSIRKFNTVRLGEVFRQIPSQLRRGRFKGLEASALHLQVPTLSKKID